MELTNKKLSSTINDNIIRIEASYFADDNIYARDIINQIFRSRKQHVTLYWYYQKIWHWPIALIKELISP